MLTFFVTIKGGSGKSTAICNLAPLVARTGSTALIDRDPNGTTARWVKYRKETKHPLIPFMHESENSMDAFEAINEMMALHDNVLFDMPGQDNVGSRHLLYYLAQTSPRPMQMVVPVKPSQPDLDLLRGVLDLVETIQAKRAAADLSPMKVHFLINEAPNTTQRERQDTLLFMTSLGIKPIPSHLHARKAFRDSMATGESVAEMKARDAGKAAEEINSVYRDIFKPKSVRRSADNSMTMGG